MQLPKKEFTLFCFAGGIGFIVDYAVILVLTSQPVGMHPLIARVFSFVCAVFTTWVLNTKLSFAERGLNRLSLKAFCTYFVAMVFGLLVNYAVFALALYLLESLQKYLQLFVAMAFGTGAGLIANFLSCHKFLFKKNSEAKRG